METKLIAILGALVLAVGAIGAVHAQSAFAISQDGSASASDSSTNSQDATNTATSTSSGSGNGNGNGNGQALMGTDAAVSPPSSDNGNGNGNALSNAESHQSIGHSTHASVHQRASCDNSGNSGVSGNLC